MNNRILYLGDTHLQNAAAYLAGLIHANGWEFDYVPSDQPAGAELFAEERSLTILSDYPAANLSGELQLRLCEQVESGGGLLMIGGWESFHGLGGNWDGTPIGEILPVEVATNDDRVNCDHPLLVAKVAEHEILADLPWYSRPPVIGGYNRVTAKPNGQTLLEARHFPAKRNGETFSFTESGCDPLLVIGTHGRGRVAAFMTDVAPHWVGPLVDWGDGRVAAQAPNAGDVEVGELYAKFIRQLLAYFVAPAA